MARRLSLALLVLSCASAWGAPLLAADAPAPGQAAAQPHSQAHAIDEKVATSERRPRARASLDQMSKQAAAVEKLALLARSEKDIVRLNCVSEKLAQVRGLVRVSQQAETELRESDARRDKNQTQHAFNKVQIAARKVGQLNQEAEQCVGQLAFYTDEKTKVEVEIPSGLPNDDPTLAVAPALIQNRPSPASGF
jgi:hypothetical protein